jgi:hypothetical protein
MLIFNCDFYVHKKACNIDCRLSYLLTFKVLYLKEVVGAVVLVAEAVI